MNKSKPSTRRPTARPKAANSSAAAKKHIPHGTTVAPTASAASLIVFAAICHTMPGTVAIVRSELNSWPWALAAATLTFAYVLAWITHAVLA